MAEGGFDAAFGGARRDEEKSRAKERVYSFRDALGPVGSRRTSARSCGIFTTAAHHKGESIRVFPLSNWTELDVWLYIHAENIPIVPLYFAKEREAVVRGNSILVLQTDVQLLARRENSNGEVPHAFARMRRRAPARSAPTPTRCRKSSTR